MKHCEYDYFLLSYSEEESFEIIDDKNGQKV
jgi:hypothetical protein